MESHNQVGWDGGPREQEMVRVALAEAKQDLLRAQAQVEMFQKWWDEIRPETDSKLLCGHKVDPTTGMHFWVEDCGRPDCGHRRDVPECKVEEYQVEGVDRR